MTSTTYDLGDVRVTLNHHTMFGLPVINEVQERKGVEKHYWYVNAAQVRATSERLGKQIRQCTAPNRKELQRKAYHLHKALHQ